MKRKTFNPYAHPVARLFWALGLATGLLGLGYGVIALLTGLAEVAIGALVAAGFGLAAALVAPYVEREYVASAIVEVWNQTAASFALLAAVTLPVPPPADRDPIVTVEGGCDK